MTERKIVVSPDEVETIVSSWVTAKVMSAPVNEADEGMSAVVLFFGPGQGHTSHNHADSEQMIFVVSGHGTQTVEVEPGNPITEPISAGSLVYIPKGAYHSTFNTGWEPLRLLALYSPAGPEAQMRESTEFRIIAAGENPQCP